MVAAGVSPEDLRFEVSEGWEQLPAGLVHQDCCGVAVDSDDNVYVLTRDESRVIVYSKDGAFLHSWGENLFSNRGHGLTIGPDDSIYCVDDGAHCTRGARQVAGRASSGRPTELPWTPPGR